MLLWALPLPALPVTCLSAAPILPSFGASKSNVVGRSEVLTRKLKWRSMKYAKGPGLFCCAPSSCLAAEASGSQPCRNVRHAQNKRCYRIQSTALNQSLDRDHHPSPHSASSLLCCSASALWCAASWRFQVECRLGSSACSTMLHLLRCKTNRTNAEPL